MAGRCSRQGARRSEGSRDDHVRVGHASTKVSRFRTRAVLQNDFWRHAQRERAQDKLRGDSHVADDGLTAKDLRAGIRNSGAVATRGRSAICGVPCTLSRPAFPRHTSKNLLGLEHGILWIKCDAYRHVSRRPPKRKPGSPPPVTPLRTIGTPPPTPSRSARPGAVCRCRSTCLCAARGCRSTSTRP